MQIHEKIFPASFPHTRASAHEFQGIGRKFTVLDVNLLFAALMSIYCLRLSRLYVPQQQQSG